MGTPFGPNTSIFANAPRSTRVTCGNRSIAWTTFGSSPPPKIPTDISDGFVLAKNAGNDDCVRRAPAIAPIARPPTNPINNTIAR